MYTADRIAGAVIIRPKQHRIHRVGDGVLDVPLIHCVRPKKTQNVVTE